MFSKTSYQRVNRCRISLPRCLITMPSMCLPSLFNTSLKRNLLYVHIVSFWHFKFLDVDKLVDVQLHKKGGNNRKERVPLVRGERCWHLRGSIIFEKKICDCLFLSLKRKQSPKFSTAIDYASWKEVFLSHKT